MDIAKAKKRARVGVAIFLALICVTSPVFVSTVSPAWAVDAWSQVGGDFDGEAAGDRLGESVSISSDGSRVAIGVPGNNGQVRVYDLAGSKWVQVGKDIKGEAGGEYFGHSVSLSSDGSRIAIGEKYNTGYAGHVRVYNLTRHKWVQVGGDIDGEAGDALGTSVSLSSDGSRVAIGAPFNDAGGLDAGLGGPDAGVVRVYNLTSGAWVQVGSDINGEAAGDHSGWNVELSSDGSRVAIGSMGNAGGGTFAGHVRVFDLTGGAWVQAGSDINGEAAGDHSGISVSMSSNGSRVAIGAGGNDDGGDRAGHVRVFDLTGGAWMQVGSDIDGEATGDGSGAAVSLSSDGSRVAIGAPENVGGGIYSGHVRVFDLTGGAWVQAGSDINGEAAYDTLGWNVELSSDGSRVAIGGPRYYTISEDAGYVRVYDLMTGLSGITSEPRSLKVTKKTNTSRTLAWTVPVSLNGGSITDYILQYRVSGTTMWSTFTDSISTSTTATITGLAKKVRYQFQVAARTSGGDSPYSTASKAG